MDINLYESDNINNNIIEEPLHLFFQEIELAIKIGPGEIWGIKYAVDLQQYLFNQYVNANQIKNELTTFINQECSQALNFNYNINVEFLNIDNKELIYIETIIYSKDDKEFIQKFLLGT